MTAYLSEVAAALPGARQRGDDVVVVDATHDSRQVVQDGLFCAIRGATVDGHDHAAQAVADGARALLVDHWLDLPVAQVLVSDVRAAAGPAAAVVHGRPTDQLCVVGVTGTNGKTTTAYLLEAAFAAHGTGVGVIGTVETRVHGEAQPGVRTTPEGTDLQRLLRHMRDRGADAVAMEVSSHGLDLHRVDGTRFAVAAWTNLTQDHLDWHGTMEAYFAAKARLFTSAFAGRGVVHLDGPWARRLLEVSEIPVVTVGRDEAADVRIVDEVADVTGSRARLVGREIDLPIATRLPGRFNTTNAALAVLSAIEAGVPAAVAAEGVAACPGAPGRLERVEAGQPFTVLVDYAHTADAVEQALETVRDLLEPDRRVVVVLGAGGDRDRAKRAPMGAAAARADVAVLTSDNPRSEDPGAILAAVADGARAAVAAGAPASVHTELDRRRAIALALALAAPGDVVVIAGKGHETGQQFADRTLPFDDRLVARELLEGSQE
ncbi:UDP-N-acetylmuramoyl-L-alanyl-D-glutamate--2,6-diaminopimelate ligase [Egicoccus halophilus]|uniref:UDP-N-acetylmuramoyl-L-alanyl-D-glutamate--2,6-diaminopimelate ligase n=1 Tax=Egicoccus halophilus TaxID=1670830 RepID=A0A8J3A669_9ACTN|nr:UDP-N-acetylmuramoyl-L-alanyl-D-glutamate--2,6-diaminopimelate ligase [Egicoccus halophilus]GGI04317.1 UDP-N-acetylmuramoyl-L-alanyl-D-glutamate--2,6-diaminopimelate ligase [Egicoccus halophilus]